MLPENCFKYLYEKLKYFLLFLHQNYGLHGIGLQVFLVFHSFGGETVIGSHPC